MKKYLNYLTDMLNDMLKKGAFHIFVGNFVIKFAGLFGSVFIVRLLTKQEYGMLGYVENLYGYAYTFAGLGLANASLRYCIIAKSEGEKHGIYSFITRAQTQFNIILIILLCGVSVLYPHPSQYANAAILIIILAVGLPFTSITSSSLCYERVMLANKRYIYFSIFSSLTSIVFRIIGAKLFGLEGTVTFRVVAETVCCLIIYFSVKQTYLADKPKFKIKRSKKIEIVTYSIHNMVANCAWTLFMLTDIFLIGRLLNDPGSLAEYKVACVIPSNMAIITSSIAIFITPYFIKNEKDHCWLRKNYAKVFGVNIVLVGMLTLFLFIFAKPFILLLYGEKYLSVVPLMRILLVAHFVNAGIKTVNSSLLSAMGYAKENMIVFLVALAVQFVLGLTIIPRFGVIGLAVNNVFMYSVMAIVFIRIFTKKFNIFQKSVL